MSGAPKACVIGWPVAHSRSPVIHGYWLEKYGIDGAYEKEAVKPEDFRGFVDTLRERGYVGANVTVPHKEAAFGRADITLDEARAVGAANTLWFDGGLLVATNTDTYGFMTHLSACVPGWEDGCGAVGIVGAGGAARAVVYGFVRAGVEDVRVFNRTVARGEAVAAHFGGGVKAFDIQELEERLGDVGVLVNTTSLGMEGKSDLDVSLGSLPDRAVVADIVYTPLMTRLLARAERRGLRTVDGLGMLLHQAVPGFEKWFGVRPAVDAELRELVLSNLGS